MVDYADVYRKGVVAKEQREAEDAARRKAENDQMLPLYEKVLPLLEKAEQNLKELSVGLNLNPGPKPTNDGRAYQYFRFESQLNHSETYGFTYSPDTKEFWAHKKGPQNDTLIFHGPISDITADQIEGVIAQAVEEIASK